jgi:hypothetical protein
MRHFPEAQPSSFMREHKRKVRLVKAKKYRLLRAIKMPQYPFYRLVQLVACGSIPSILRNDPMSLVRYRYAGMPISAH